MGDVDLACGGVEPAPGVSDLARRTADLPEQLGEEATTTEPAMAAATPQPPHKPKIHWGEVVLASRSFIHAPHRDSAGVAGRPNGATAGSVREDGPAPAVCTTASPTTSYHPACPWTPLTRPAADRRAPATS